jgi:hypothetical protein
MGWLKKKVKIRYLFPSDEELKSRALPQVLLDDNRASRRGLGVLDLRHKNSFKKLDKLFE